MADRYVDLSSQVTGTGTSNDPFNFIDLYYEVVGPSTRYYWISSVYNGDTFYIKGGVDFTSGDDLRAIGQASDVQLKSWDTAQDPVNGVDAPWVLTASGGRMSLGGAVLIEKGFLGVNTFLQHSTDTTYITSTLKTDHTDVLDGYIEGAVMYGCTIIGALDFVSDSATYVMQDTLVGNDSTSDYDSITVNAARCAFTNDTQPTSLGTYTECQFGLAEPSFPVLDASKESWKSSVVGIDITSPPQPGTLPYTGYDTDPWGNPRCGIGALYYQPYINRFSQNAITAGQEVTSRVTVSELVSKIQDAGSDTYFDSTSEVSSVEVRYLHEDGRQRLTVFHDGSTGSFSFGSVARDGTWEKSRVITRDNAGASNVLDRSGIGALEDLVMTDGTMTLNT